MASRPTRDRALADLSRRQFGAASRLQLLNCGFTEASLRRAAQRGELVPVFPRVFRVAAVPVSLEQRLISAVLYGEPNAALCGPSAAQACGLLPRRSSKIHIVSGRRLSPQPGLVVRRRRLLLPGDLRYVGPLPVTDVGRTLLDLCSIDALDAEIALDAALRLGRITFEELFEVLDMASDRHLRGADLLRGLLSVRGEEEAMSESELESSFIRVLRGASFPLPQRQVTVEWEQCYRLDFLYPEHDLVVEVDGRKWHASRERFQGDRRRDNAALLEGKRVIRLTWQDVTRDQPYVVSTIGRALGILTLL